MTPFSAPEIVLQRTEYDSSGRVTKRFDALDRQTTLTYPTLGQQTTFPSGLIRKEIAYSDGSPRQTYQAGESADAFATLVSGGQVARQRYVFNTTTQTNGPLAETSYSDFAGRGFKRVWGDGATEMSYFNAKGQVVRTVDADGVTTLFAYNSLGEQEVVCVDVNGDGVIGYGTSDRITRTTSHYESRAGGGSPYVVRVTSVERWETVGSSTSRTVVVNETSMDGDRGVNTVNGLATTTTVTRNRPAATWVQTTIGPDGTTSLQSYANGLLQSATVTHPTGSLQLSSQTFGYDPHQRLASVTDARTGTTSYSYFADDQIHTVTTPDPDPTRTGNGYDPQVTTYGYDSAGRQQTVTLPDNGVVNTAYYASGLVQRQWGARITPVNYVYDSVGRLINLTTEGTVAATTTWTYDPVRGWLTAKRYADNTGPNYDYRPSGRLYHRMWVRQVAGAPLTTTYSYNTAGDLSGVDYSDATPDVTLAYDRVGRPNSTTDGSGTHTQAYHLSGQPGNEAYTSGLLNGLSMGRTFDSLSRLSGLTAPSVPSVAYSYDAASRLQTVTSSTLSATYSYLTNSSLIGTTTLKNGGVTRLTATNVYDNLNRLASKTSTPSASAALAYVYTYNNANQRTRTTREDNAYWDYGYDTLGQVTSGRKKLSGGAVMLGFDFTYGYDPVGNRTTSTANRLTTSYTTNNLLNQYTSLQAPPHLYVRGTADATATVTAETQAVVRQGDSFDTNVLFDPATLGGTKSVKISAVKNNYGAGGEDLVAEQTRTGYVAPATVPVVHDEDGNLTDDARWHYTWDAENRLTQIETAAAAITAGVARQKLEFVYDASGRRVSKKVSNWNAGAYVLASHLLFLYDGWNMVAELNALSANAVIRTYVWGSDLSGSGQGAGGVGGLIAARESTASHFATYDGNGNITGYINVGTGTTTASFEFGAFAETPNDNESVADSFRFRFSSKYADKETKLIYYGLRYFQPGSGRWLSRDPLEEKAGPSLYGFLLNNGVNDVDPLGLERYIYGFGPIGPVYPKAAQYLTSSSYVPEWLQKFITSHSLPEDYGALFRFAAKHDFTNYAPEPIRGEMSVSAPGSEDAKTVFVLHKPESLNVWLTLMRSNYGILSSGQSEQISFEGPDYRRDFIQRYVRETGSGRGRVEAWRNSQITASSRMRNGRSGAAVDATEHIANAVQTYDSARRDGAVLRIIYDKCSRWEARLGQSERSTTYRISESIGRSRVRDYYEFNGYPIPAGF